MTMVLPICFSVCLCMCVCVCVRVREGGQSALSGDESRKPLHKQRWKSVDGLFPHHVSIKVFVDPSAFTLVYTSLFKRPASVNFSVAWKNTLWVKDNWTTHTHCKTRAFSPSKSRLGCQKCVYYG